MSDASNDVRSAVAPLARANRTVVSVAERLASGAVGLPEGEARTLMLTAAQDLLGVIRSINGTLTNVVGVVPEVSRQP